MNAWCWPPCAGGVRSFNGRTGAVVPVAGDYTSTLVTNLSGVAGATVTDALNALATAVLAVGRPSTSNKNMVASVTVADFDLACATAIATTPQGYVGVAINGILYTVGAKTDPIYFSGDGGVTARAQGSIVAGDLPYFVGSVAGYQLAASDRIDYFYNAP